MNLEENISVYLPKYLSAESQDELYSELKNFPSNDPNIFFSTLNSSAIFQGDAMNDFPLISLPDQRVENSAVLILSNTCDTDPSNFRFFPSFLVYCPLIKLSKYTALLEKNNVSKDKIDNHIKDIKNQKITQIMFFPKSRYLEEDYISFFERINHISSQFVSRDSIESRRIFSLSNFGFYLLLIKLSMHFTRIREGVDRRSEHY